MVAPVMPVGLAPKRALVLGGGGAFGVIQAAYIQALSERGYRPDLVVGTSVGALNGAWLAMHPDRPEELLEVWRELGKLQLLRWNPFPIAGRLLRGRLGLWPNEIVPRLISTHVEGRRFEDARIPLVVVATNLTRGRKQTFHTGDLGPAIMASTAIPGVFDPVEIDGELFVDGGITATIDLATAYQLGATEILAVDLTPPADTARPRTAIGVLRLSLAALSRSTMDAMQECLSDRVAVRVTTPDLSQHSPWALTVSDEAIAQNLAVAREAVRVLVDEHGAVIPGPHHHWVCEPAPAAARGLRGAFQRLRTPANP